MVAEIDYNTYIANISPLNYLFGEKAVRQVSSPFHSRGDTQLNRVKSGTLLYRIPYVPN